MDNERKNKALAVWHDLNLACKRLETEGFVPEEAKAVFEGVKNNLKELHGELVAYRKPEHLTDEHVDNAVSAIVDDFEIVLGMSSDAMDQKEIAAGVFIEEGYTVRDHVKEFIGDYYDHDPTRIGVKRMIDEYREYDLNTQLVKDLKGVANHFSRVAVAHKDVREELASFTMTLMRVVDNAGEGRNPMEFLADFNKLIRSFEAKGQDASSVRRGFKDIQRP